MRQSYLVGRIRAFAVQRAPSDGLRVRLAFVATAGLGLALAAPADAQPADTRAKMRPGHGRPVSLSRGGHRTAAEAQGRFTRPLVDTSRRPHDPLITVISIASQSIEVFGPEGSILRSRVSTGQRGHDTPTGVFSVLQRNRYHRSNIYSGAPMPYMQRLTWSGIALHEGHLPGFPASHGCIRMTGSFAQTMWGIGRLGMRVIVSPTDVRPVSVDHPALPQPTAGADARSAALIRIASSADTPVPPAPAPSAALAPYLLAQERLAKATADKTAAEKAVKPAHDAALEKSAEARRLSETLKASAGILADAEEHLDLETFAMSTVQTEEAEADVLARIRRAEAGVKAAREAHAKLQATERRASDDAFAAATAAREANEAVIAATQELRAARRAIEPISMFVSRKTGRVYVRQGFGQLADEPVTIAEPDRPLGTHVFTAVEPMADGPRVRWVAVSVPTTGGGASRGKAERDRPARGIQSTPAEALDRIKLPEDVAALMAQRVWPGASIIVSDFGLGETGEETDFVITTH